MNDQRLDFRLETYKLMIRYNIKVNFVNFMHCFLRQNFDFSSNQKFFLPKRAVNNERVPPDGEPGGAETSKILKERYRRVAYAIVLSDDWNTLNRMCADRQIARANQQELLQCVESSGDEKEIQDAMIAYLRGKTEDVLARYQVGEKEGDEVLNAFWHLEDLILQEVEGVPVVIKAPIAKIGQAVQVELTAVGDRHLVGDDDLFVLHPRQRGPFQPRVFGKHPYGRHITSSTSPVRQTDPAEPLPEADESAGVVAIPEELRGKIDELQNLALVGDEDDFYAFFNQMDQIIKNILWDLVGMSVGLKFPVPGSSLKVPWRVSVASEIASKVRPRIEIIYYPNTADLNIKQTHTLTLFEFFKLEELFESFRP